jgi:hypothetical protein
MIVKLKKNQFDYLSYNLAKEQELLILKLKKIKEENQSVTVVIDEENAEKICDWASEKLQKIGFDINYELTPDGEILENIIDLFFLEK